MSFTVRVQAANSESARDHTGFTKREALDFIKRGGEVDKIRRFPRLYCVVYKPKSR